MFSNESMIADKLPVTIAIVPCKNYSQRLPCKNRLPIRGMPLWRRKVEQLLNTQLVDTVVIATDSDEIEEVYPQLYESNPSVELVLRPPPFCDERRLSLQDRIDYIVRQIDKQFARQADDLVLWAHCTNPLVRPETYDEATRMFMHLMPQRKLPHCYDSLLSVTKIQTHVWSRGEGGRPLPLTHDPEAPEHQVAAECEPLYAQNGAIFIQCFDDMLRNRYLYGRRPHLFQLPEGEDLDIDTKADYDEACRRVLQSGGLHEDVVTSRPQMAKTGNTA